MQRREVDRRVMGAPRGLAVDSHDITGQFQPNGLDPREKGTLKGARIEAGKDTAKRIVGANAVGQCQKLAQERLPGAPVGFDVGPAIRANVGTISLSQSIYFTPDS